MSGAVFVTVKLPMRYDRILLLKSKLDNYCSDITSDRTGFMVQSDKNHSISLDLKNPLVKDLKWAHINSIS